MAVDPDRLAIDPDPTRMRKRRPRRSRRRRLLARSIAVVLVACVVAIVGRQLWYLGWVWYYVDHNPTTTAFMDQRRAELRASEPDARLDYRWVPYDRISPWLKRAVIASEDQRFVSHNGFDWEALRKAFERNMKADEVVRGGSTITQQLAKNLFLSPRQTYVRKIQEAVITVMLESTMTKRRILELYLNLIEWGDHEFGAEAAAEHYFGRPASSLDPWSASLLAARIPNPRYYDGQGVTNYLYERAAWINGWANQVRIPTGERDR